jgi:hypothetical protein
MFPEYVNQNREDYNPYNLPDIITGKKDSEENNSNDKKEHEKVIILGRMYTCL